jgi:hypothetical protein
VKQSAVELDEAAGAAPLLHARDDGLVIWVVKWGVLVDVGETHSGAVVGTGWVGRTARG